MNTDINELQLEELRKITSTLSGRNDVEIPTELNTTRYAYVITGDEDGYLTGTSGLFTKYNISSYKQGSSLQNGVSEFIFTCTFDVYQSILQEIIQKGLKCVVQMYRMPLQSSVGTISAVLTGSDIKVGSTDQTSANAKYIKVSADGTIVLPAITIDSTTNTIKIDSSNNAVKDIPLTSITKGTAITLTGTSATQLVVASTPCRIVRVYCSTLASVIYLGGSGVDTSDHLEKISAVGIDNSVDIPIDNANKIYVVGSNNDVVRFQVLA